MDFMAPNLSMTAKIIYVIITYNLYNIAYSFFEVPYGGLLTTITKDYDAVNSAGSIRSFMGAIGIAGIGYCASLLLNLFDKAEGMINSYTLTALVFGAGILASGILVKQCIKESFVPAKEGDEDSKTGVMEIIRIALTNKPLIIVVLVNFLTNLAWLLRDASTIYFFQYVVNRVDLLAMYIAIAGFSQLPIIAVLPKLTARFGNKRVIVTATILSLLGFGLLYGGMQGNVVLVMVSAAISGTGWSVFYGLMFGMIANTVEYGEWKNGVRTAGISTSLPLLAFKLAMGLSSLILGLLLKYGGYIAGAVQTATASAAINAGFIFIPAALAVLWLIAILFYDLDKLYPTIVKELEERKASVVQYIHVMQLNGGG